MSQWLEIFNDGELTPTTGKSEREVENRVLLSMMIYRPVATTMSLSTYT